MAERNRESVEGIVLYEEERIKINTSPTEIDGHNVWIGLPESRMYFLLQRGILNDIAEHSSQDRIEQMLGTLNPIIPNVLRENKISPEYFALACARAKMKQEEISRKRYAEFLKNMI